MPDAYPKFIDITEGIYEMDEDFTRSPFPAWKPSKKPKNPSHAWVIVPAKIGFILCGLSFLCLVGSVYYKPLFLVAPTLSYTALIGVWSVWLTYAIVIWIKSFWVLSSHKVLLKNQEDRTRAIKLLKKYNKNPEELIFYSWIEYLTFNEDNNFNPHVGTITKRKCTFEKLEKLLILEAKKQQSIIKEALLNQNK